MSCRRRHINGSLNLFVDRIYSTTGLILSLQHLSQRRCDDLVYFATRVPDPSDTRATRMTRVRHKCGTSATRTTRVRHECYMNDSATRVKNFDFDNDTIENIFSHSYISYMVNERLQGEEQFHSKNFLLEMPRSHAKIHLKSAPLKMNFVMAKAISKSYTLNCSCKYPCTFLHSYA